MTTEVSNIFQAAVTPLFTFDTPDYADPMTGVTLLGGRTTVDVASAAQLTTALANAVAGQTIQLAAGVTYAGGFTLNNSGPANDPIIVKGAANHASRMTGVMTFNGNYGILDGVDMDAPGCGFSFHGINNKVLRCKFRNWTRLSCVGVGSNNATGERYAEFAYNEMGPAVGGVGTGNFSWGFKGHNSATPDSSAKDVWVHHNWFRDMQGGWSGRSDVIEAGESGEYPWMPTEHTGWYIEDNLFSGMGHGSQEIVDIKMGGVVLRRNTVTDSPSVKFGFRSGSSATGISIMESNYMETGQIMVFAKNKYIVNNYVPNGGIRIFAGDVEWDDLSRGHAACVDALVAGNESSNLEIGDYFDAGTYVYDALSTVIEEHTGTIQFHAGYHTGTVDNRNQPSSYRAPDPVKLTTADVGPAAFDNAPAAYRASREP